MPKSDQLHWALSGRSNVGKSSLLNALLKTSVSRTSKTPGRTQNLAYIKSKKGLIFDLPGYGYANVSKSIKEHFVAVIQDYIIQQDAHFFVLIDSRRGIMDIDMDFMNFLETYHRSFSIVLTKTDKISNNRITYLLQDIQTVLTKYSYFDKKIWATSVKNGLNIKILREYLGIVL